MLEMFTDVNHMRLDDFRLPADMRNIVPHKTPCYNKNMAGDGPSPIKREERMTSTLTLKAIEALMAPFIECEAFTTYRPKQGQLMVISGNIGHQHPLLSVTVSHESGRITLSYNIGIPPKMFISEEDMVSYSVQFELFNSVIPEIE